MIWRNIAMLGQIYGIPHKMNAQVWDLGLELGNGFETHIYQVLSSMLSAYFKYGVTIRHTSASRDDGKDIIIESPIDLDFLGVPFLLNGKDRVKIYLECKSSNQGYIPYNQFAGNLSRIKDDQINYYVLITNTSIAPYSFYQFYFELKQQDITFYLLDQLLLGRLLNRMNAEIGNYVSPADIPESNIEYQVLSTYRDGKPVFELFLLARNYQQTPVNMQLRINTDRNWNISQQDIHRVLAPYSTDCIKLLIRKEYYDGLDELLLTMDTQGQEIFTQIKGLNWECNFIPPLYGKMHMKMIDSLTAHIQSLERYSFSYIWGAAGVGKTRVIDELLGRLEGRGVETAVFRCTVENNMLTQQVKQFLIKKRFLDSNTETNSLPDILSRAEVHFQKCLIVIDDLHNASPGLLAEVKQAAQLKLPYPIILLVAGRNDYSAGDLEYYSLIQWCIDSQEDNGQILECFDMEDTKHFIRLIIRDIPQFALDKIYNLSNCNPLFIVETIEYLLEMDLVHIINRSTVGIQNLESFASKLYIPHKIEDIYKDRFNSLAQLDEGIALQDFLLACSLLGIKFHYNVAMAFFDDPENSTRELFHRRFLQLGANGEWQFAHESLYLFIKHYASETANQRTRSASLVYEMHQIFCKLDSLQKGRISLWAGHRREAINFFRPAVEKISQVENHSNIDIERRYYEYLEDMYQCVCTPSLREKIILCKLYIALHYYTPYIAIEQCQWARKQIAKSSSLKTQ